MRKSKCFVLGLFIMLLAGCGKNEIAPSEKMPTMAELQNYYYSHTQEEYDDKVREIRDIIDSTSYEELCGILTESFDEWASSQKSLVETAFSVDFSKDDLLMNDQGNERMYNNLFAEVDVHFDPEENKKSSRSLLNDQIKEALRKTPYGSYKINSITIRYYDKNQEPGASPAKKVAGETASFYLNNEILAVELPEDEKNIQAAVYHHVKEWNHEEFGDSQEGGYGEIRLRRFSMEQDEGDLFAEILIDSLPPGLDKQSFFDTLEGRGEELFQSIMADRESMSFLESREADSVKVTFHTPWGSDVEHENEYHVYEYRIKE